MPSFRRSGIDSISHVPTFQKKINDLRILIHVIENSQDFFLGRINGEVLKGAKFLARLAREFGASLFFYPEEWAHPTPQGGPKARLFHKTERRSRHKMQPFPALESSPLQ